MSRFMRKGVTDVRFVATTVSTTAPTAASINTAPIDLQNHINEMTGFTFSNNPIMTPDLGSAFVSQIPGEDASSDSSIKIYEDTAASASGNATEALAALVKGTNGFIVICSKGFTGGTATIGDKVDVWPVTVSSQAKQYTVGNEAAVVEVKFAITAPPSAANVNIAT